MMPPYKNSEYYTDWTAYKAIQNIERKKSTMLIAPVKNPLPGQVYETTSTNGNTFTVLVLAASQDDTVSTTRVYDSPRLINSQNIRVNNRMMYVDPSKMGFAQNANLTGLIGTLPPEDMIKVRRAMVSIYNLGTAAADVPAIPDAPAPVVEKPWIRWKTTTRPASTRWKRNWPKPRRRQSSTSRKAMNMRKRWKLCPLTVILPRIF